MTEPMSDDAKESRAKNARKNLANLGTASADVASRLADALAPEHQEPVARAHITETPGTAPGSCIDRQMEVLDEGRLQPEDSPVDLFAAPTGESSIAAIQNQNIDDLRRLLAAADARIIALEDENRRLRSELQDLSQGHHS